MKQRKEKYQQLASVSYWQRLIGVETTLHPYLHKFQNIWGNSYSYPMWELQRSSRQKRRDTHSPSDTNVAREHLYSTQCYSHGWGKRDRLRQCNPGHRDDPKSGLHKSFLCPHLVTTHPKDYYFSDFQHLGLWLPVFELNINGIIEYELLAIRCFSLNIVLVRFIHVVLLISRSFILLIL